MTLLELVNLVRSEAGIGNSNLAGLGGLNAENNRVLDWVRREYLDLQAAHDEWQFMRREFEFDTVANQAFYTPQQAKATEDGTAAGAPILADWKLDSFRISTTGQGYADEQIAGYITYEDYRNLYQYGSSRNDRSKPVVFTVRPSDKAIGLGLTPDGAYRVVGEFFRTPHELVLAGDEPILPPRFHALIGYRALRAYGIFMAAPEVIGRADEKIGVLYGQLCNDQLPMLMSGPPLA